MSSGSFQKIGYHGLNSLIVSSLRCGKRNIFEVAGVIFPWMMLIVSFTRPILDSLWPHLKVVKSRACSSRRKLCDQRRNSLYLFLGHIQFKPTFRKCNGSVESQTSVSIPFSIFTATVRQVGDFLMPNADACTTFPKAPLPSDLPTMKRIHWFFLPSQWGEFKSFSGSAIFPICSCEAHVTLNGISEETDPKSVISWVNFFQLFTVLLRYPHSSQLCWAPRRPFVQVDGQFPLHKILLEGRGHQILGSLFHCLITLLTRIFPCV